MAEQTRSGDSARDHDAAGLRADEAAALIAAMFAAQRLQWEAMSAWQQSLLAFNQDLWEQWACHFGGGVPIDA